MKYYKNINLNQDLIGFDTNLYIYYYQWVNDKIKTNDQDKCGSVRNIFNTCIDNNIKIYINNQIFYEIKSVSNRLKLYFDKKMVVDITGLSLDHLNQLKPLNDNKSAIILDWVDKESKIGNSFNTADMKIYFLLQRDIDKLKYYEHYIFYTEDLGDFKNCNKIYIKYYKQYNLPFKSIDIKHFRLFKL